MLISKTNALIINLVSVEFERKQDGEQCPSSRIKQESICKKAADDLGLVWGGIVGTDQQTYLGVYSEMMDVVKSTSIQL